VAAYGLAEHQRGDGSQRELAQIAMPRPDLVQRDGRKRVEDRQ
jgi:hypothetical protein